ncbi:MAG: hypothetical protein QOC79_825 [Actinomycetota bacterium]|nr:hypothetical protein [Actinomycetota bacterium]
MPQFPPWHRQIVAWPEAARMRQSQLRQVVSELAGRTRSRCEQLPGAMVGELRRRVNVLDLATKHDVAAQSRLGRNRVSFVLKEFLDAQRDHDEALLESLRSELREELQSFAAAIDDDLFATDEQPPSTDAVAPKPPPVDLDLTDEDEDDDDDELDLMGEEATTPKRGSR